jgi:hypothetical protein
VSDILLLIARCRDLSLASKRIYEESRKKLQALLESVGGHATTSPDDKGLTLDFHWKAGAGGLSFGVSQEVLHPEIGDQCREIELAERVVASEATQCRMLLGQELFAKYPSLLPSDVYLLADLAIVLEELLRSEP